MSLGVAQEQNKKKNESMKQTLLSTQQHHLGNVIDYNSLISFLLNPALMYEC